MDSTFPINFMSLSKSRSEIQDSRLGAVSQSPPCGVQRLSQKQDTSWLQTAFHNSYIQHVIEIKRSIQTPVSLQINKWWAKSPRQVELPMDEQAEYIRRIKDQFWAHILNPFFFLGTSRDVKNSFGVQLLSWVWLFMTAWTAAHQASLSFTISWSLLKCKSIELVVPSNHLILCRSLLLPSVFSNISIFSNELALHIRWPVYWSFSFSVSPFNEYSGLISFKIDWFDLFAAQGTLKSLLQHHSSKASILWCSAFFIVQLSHSYLTTGKTIALTI